MLILSSFALVIFPMSIFDGLINQLEILRGKLSLWSFTVIYICDSHIFSILSLIDKDFCDLTCVFIYFIYAIFVSISINFCNILYFN